MSSKRKLTEGEAPTKVKKSKSKSSPSSRSDAKQAEKAARKLEKRARKEAAEPRADVELEEQSEPEPAPEADVEVEGAELKEAAASAPAPAPAPTSTVTAAPAPTWDDYSFDPRLLQAIVEQKFSSPTAVQAKVIALAFEGHDVLARSRTGSGKTAAYLLPIIQSLLSVADERRRIHETSNAVSAVVLVPTRELAAQVTKNTAALLSHSGQSVRVENLARKEDDAVQQARLATNPDIIVATPSRLVANINRGSIELSKLRYLVIDEADLIFSYGYEEDLKVLAALVPESTQTFLMSATLQTEEDFLKGMFCRRGDLKVVELDSSDEAEQRAQVTQYAVRCAEDEKFLLLYALFKLRLVRGKSIVFVGDLDRSYRVKLFLEQFGIKSCVLNSELPVNSRIHVVEQFNKGVYDIIIASDENEVVGTEGRPDEDEDKDEKDKGEEDKKKKKGESAKEKAGGKATSKRSKEYGVSRGIDFKHVACVLNFDLPPSSKSYVHRIGRTGRGKQTGMAMSFVIPSALYRKHKPTSFWGSEHDEKVLAKIERGQEKRGQSVQPYQFDMAALDGFRYRLRDALKSVTAVAVREARVRELKNEILNSEVLQKHFAENPDELRMLRHDNELRPAHVMAHMKHVPDYLLPKGLQKNAGENQVGFVPLNKPESSRKKRLNLKRKGGGGGRRSADPLQNLKRRK